MVIRVVLDANALVSGFPATSETMANLIEHWRAGTFELVVSEHIINEVTGPGPNHIGGPGSR
jgi:predicted nucleic acid-binding protein